MPALRTAIPLPGLRGKDARRVPPRIAQIPADVQRVRELRERLDGHAVPAPQRRTFRRQLATLRRRPRHAAHAGAEGFPPPCRFRSRLQLGRLRRHRSLQIRAFLPVVALAEGIVQPPRAGMPLRVVAIKRLLRELRQQLAHRRLKLILPPAFRLGLVGHLLIPGGSGQLIGYRQLLRVGRGRLRFGRGLHLRSRRRSLHHRRLRSRLLLRHRRRSPPHLRPLGGRCRRHRFRSHRSRRLGRGRGLRLLHQLELRPLRRGFLIGLIQFRRRLAGGLGLLIHLLQDVRRCALRLARGFGILCRTRCFRAFIGEDIRQLLVGPVAGFADGFLALAHGPCSHLRVAAHVAGSQQARPSDELVATTLEPWLFPLTLLLAAPAVLLPRLTLGRLHGIPHQTTATLGHLAHGVRLPQRGMQHLPARHIDGLVLFDVGHSPLNLGDLLRLQIPTQEATAQLVVIPHIRTAIPLFTLDPLGKRIHKTAVVEVRELLVAPKLVNERPPRQRIQCSMLSVQC